MFSFQLTTKTTFIHHAPIQMIECHSSMQCNINFTILLFVSFWIDAISFWYSFFVTIYFFLLAFYWILAFFQLMTHKKQRVSAQPYVQIKQCDFWCSDLCAQASNIQFNTFTFLFALFTFQWMRVFIHMFLVLIFDFDLLSQTTVSSQMIPYPKTFLFIVYMCGFVNEFDDDSCLCEDSFDSFNCEFVTSCTIIANVICWNGLNFLRQNLNHTMNAPHLRDEYECKKMCMYEREYSALYILKCERSTNEGFEIHSSSLYLSCS